MNSLIRNLVFVDEKFDVRQRLEELQIWKKQFEDEDELLEQMVGKLLKFDDPLQTQQAWRLVNLRQIHAAGLVKQPLVFSTETLENGHSTLLARMQEQFATLSQEERLLWLFHLSPVISPEFQTLNGWFENIPQNRQANVLVNAPAGMGKTYQLNWLASQDMVILENDFYPNRVVKVDAPVGNRFPLQTLLRRLLLACGDIASEDDENELLAKLVSKFQTLGVEVVIIDNVDFLLRPTKRHDTTFTTLRRIPNVSFIGISSVSSKKTEEAGIQGFWSDSPFEILPYTGNRLESLLTILEILLPFPNNSHLTASEMKNDLRRSDDISGPVRLIEKWTGGILANIMTLIICASRKAILQEASHLSISLLAETWSELSQGELCHSVG